MDKSILSSLTNKGSITTVIGALFLLIGEPLCKGIKPEPIQIVGYLITFTGVLMYMIGSRRATGTLINRVGDLHLKLEESRVELTKLTNGHNNGHDLDDTPTIIK